MYSPICKRCDHKSWCVTKVLMAVTELRMHIKAGYKIN